MRKRQGVYRVLVYRCWYTGCWYTGCWCANRRVRDYLEDPDVDRSIILRRIFRKWDVGTWTGLIWLRIGTGGGHL